MSLYNPATVDRYTLGTAEETNAERAKIKEAVDALEAQLTSLASASGVLNYTWIAYADSADGTSNFTTGLPEGRQYIGLAFNKGTSTPSTNPADYSWHLFAPSSDIFRSIADGTASAPGLAFLNDLNTGLHRSAADTLKIITGGNDRVKIDNVVRIRNHNGTPSVPTEAGDWPYPVLNLTGFGNYPLQTMLALSLPNDPDSFTDDSVWNVRLMQTPSSTTSAGIAGIFVGGPGFMTLNPSGAVCINGHPDANGGAIVGSGAHRVAALSGYANSSWDSGDYTAHQFVHGSSQVGTITCTASATAYNTSSDYRLKNVDGPLTGSGDYIDALRPVEGTWKVDGSPFVGLIAHEVQGVSRTRVATGEKDGEEVQGLDYSSAEIIANLIAEVQSLRLRVAAQAQRQATIEARLAALEAAT